MKKLLCLILTFAIILSQISFLPTYAEPDIHLAHNDTLVSNISAPVLLRNNLYYVRLNFFEEALRLKSIYDGVTNSLVVYTNQNNSASFNLNNNTVTTSDGKTEKNVRVLYDGGFYLPAKWVSNFLNYEAVYISAVDTLRIKNNSATLSDDEFVRSIYQPATPSDETVITTPLGFLFLDLTEREIDYAIDKLDDFKIKSIFFISEQDILKRPNSVIKILLHNHTIGFVLSSTGNKYFTAENVTSELERLNNLLFALAKRKTRLYTVYEKDQKFITIKHRDNTYNAGYRIWSGSLSYYGTSAKEVTSEIDKIMNTIHGKPNIAIIRISGGKNFNSALSQFLMGINTATERTKLVTTDEVTTPINKWFDVR